MSDATEQVRNYYDAVGSAFDASYDWDGPLYPSNRIRLDHALDVLDRELQGRGRILDAGCGTGIAMAELLGRGYDAQGFDFSTEAIRAARQRLGPDGWRVWVGDLEEPVLGAGPQYDGCLVIGALTHPLDAPKVLRNLHAVMRPGALLVVELRNEVFDALTFNEFTLASLKRWLPESQLREDAIAHLTSRLYRRPPIPPRSEAQRAHEAFFSVPSAWRNPLTVGEEYRAAGFEPVDTLYFHMHAVPPVFESIDPKEFRRLSLAMEKDPRDWRGLLVASAFLLVARRT